MKVYDLVEIVDMRYPHSFNVYLLGIITYQFMLDDLRSMEYFCILVGNVEYIRGIEDIRLISKYRKN